MLSGFSKGVSCLVSHVLLSVWFAWCLVFIVNTTNQTSYINNICSAQSENLIAQSRDCVVHSQNPETAHYSCVISRLRTIVVRS